MLRPLPSSCREHTASQDALPLSFSLPHRLARRWHSTAEARDSVRAPGGPLTGSRKSQLLFCRRLRHNSRTLAKVCSAAARLAVALAKAGEWHRSVPGGGGSQRRVWRHYLRECRLARRRTARCPASPAAPRATFSVTWAAFPARGWTASCGREEDSAVDARKGRTESVLNLRRVV